MTKTIEAAGIKLVETLSDVIKSDRCAYGAFRVLRQEIVGKNTVYLSSQSPVSGKPLRHITVTADGWCHADNGHKYAPAAGGEKFALDWLKRAS